MASSVKLFIVTTETSSVRVQKILLGKKKKKRKNNRESRAHFQAFPNCSQRPKSRLTKKVQAKDTHWFIISVRKAVITSELNFKENLNPFLWQNVSLMFFVSLENVFLLFSDGQQQKYGMRSASIFFKPAMKKLV